MINLKFEAYKFSLYFFCEGAVTLRRTINLTCCALHFKKPVPIGAGYLYSTKEALMANNVEDFQKFSKDQIATATTSSSSFVKNLQTIAAETADYSKRHLKTAHLSLKNCAA